MIRNVICSFLIMLLVPMATLAQQEVTITDDFIQPGETKTLTSDTVWILDGFVFVEDGSELFIEPGTVIKGNPGTGADASALIIARGGKIFAEGSPTEPIIFTAVSDDPVGSLPLDANGLWGGVIILGNSSLNSEPGTTIIEGIPSTETRGLYGCGDTFACDEEDDSGVFRFVSIRHGGSEIGAGNEINGLTMGAVGSGTTIEFVEVFNNLDDGFEWFGGTVNTRNLVAAFAGDDAYDYDEGFRGKGQFWFAIQREGNRAGEHDGGTDPEDGTPFATPTIYNATYIGNGSDTAGDNDTFVFRDNAGGFYFNSIFTEFANEGLVVEDLPSGEDSRSRLEAGDLDLANNIWWNFGAGNNPEDFITQQFVRDVVLASGKFNEVVDPQLGGISRTDDGGLDPRPLSGSPAFGGNLKEIPAGDDFIQSVDYKGAFGPGDLWINGWTAISQRGIVAQLNEGEQMITDDFIQPGETKTLTSDTVWILDGFVFVEDGSELFIEPGTVIKGNPGTGADASALIIARGGKIFAEGTPSQPIIFTAVSDDPVGSLPLDANGLWGGVIILGNSSLNSEPGTTIIEGIPSTETRGLYGCGDTFACDEEDDSGVFRYVSIRHGGSEIGAGNEINGLTMGAVGSGTTIEFVEVFNNLDDGFEWFGGTVNTKYLIAAFAGDDAYDYDEGFRGKGQFWFAIQREGNRAGEHDGGTDPEDGTPFATPTIFNATYIGNGSDTAGDNDTFVFRDNAGGFYFNSIFTEFANEGLVVEDLPSGEDSRSRLEAGDLDLANNIWWNFGAGNNPEDFITQQFVRDVVLASGKFNEVVDPQFGGISRDPDGGLNPLPFINGPAFENVRSVPQGDEFFEQVNYRGAFGTENWATGWSAISQLGILGSVFTDIEDEVVFNDERPNDIRLEQNFPNPFNPSTVIRFQLPESQRVTLKVYDVTGRLVTTLVDGVRSAGTNEIRFDASSLASGVYLYRLQSSSVTLTRSLTLIK